jgi:hypothetical protein
MQKNTTGQKWVVFAFDSTTNAPKTGDAANITANLRIDGGAANPVDDTNPAELEGGYYIFDITQAESNGNLILIAPSSTTANIQVIGVPGAVYTTPASFNAGVIQSGDSYAIVNNGTYGNSAIETLVDGIEATLGAAGAGLTGVPWNAAWAAEVQSECADALTAYDPPTQAEMTSAFTEIKGATWATTDTLEAIRDRGDAAWVTATGFATSAALATAQADLDTITGSGGAVLAADQAVNATKIGGSSSAATQLALSAVTIVNGAAITGTLSTTQMTTNLTEVTDDHYNGRVIIWTSGVLINQATAITDYVGATKLFTYTATTEAPSNGDTFIIV